MSVATGQAQPVPVGGDDGGDLAVWTEGHVGERDPALGAVALADGLQAATLVRPLVDADDVDVHADDRCDLRDRHGVAGGDEERGEVVAVVVGVEGDIGDQRLEVGDGAARHGWAAMPRTGFARQSRDSRGPKPSGRERFRSG